MVEGAGTEAATLFQKAIAPTTKTSTNGYSYFADQNWTHSSESQAPCRSRQVSPQHPQFPSNAAGSGSTPGSLPTIAPSNCAAVYGITFEISVSKCESQCHGGIQMGIAASTRSK